MLKKTFCSSPWFHYRLTYNGNYEKCRWVKSADSTANIATTSPLVYFTGDEMSAFRKQFLNGESPEECNTCYYQEEFNKLSGRQKQLLKSAIRTDDFYNSIKSSPHFNDFTTSYFADGCTDRIPTDLQIDLGNICNSACIMCEPRASSRLAQDYKKLYKLSPLFEKPESFTPWTENKELLDRFINDLPAGLKYIHLLGGETLYNRAFYDICNALINLGLTDDVIVGTTTNGTIYTEELERIIPRFKEFHLGISIESVSKLNDYIRYPSHISDILSNINKFIKLREQYPGLHITLRITPNVFTIYEIDQLFEYMIENRITAEACNILHKPECLRMELMPDDIRKEVIDKLEKIVLKYNMVKHNVANVRNHYLIDQVTADTVLDYLEFIKNYNVPENVNELRVQLVEFLKSFESIRSNSILEYAPRYKEFLSTIGY